MAYQVATFNSKQDYTEWLERMGDSIRIVSVSESRKNWSIWSGFMNLENAATITVTYEMTEPKK